MKALSGVSYAQFWVGVFVMLLCNTRQVWCGKTGLSYTGRIRTYTKPAGYNAVRFWMWGGGGGAGCNWYNTQSLAAYPPKQGAGGGYMSGVVFGLQPDSSVLFNVEVGGGGKVRGGSAAWPDGGAIA
eukprot:2549084-Rhodomonas_salina.1